MNILFKEGAMVRFLFQRMRWHKISTKPSSYKLHTINRSHSTSNNAYHNPSFRHERISTNGNLISTDTTSHSQLFAPPYVIGTPIGTGSVAPETPPPSLEDIHLITQLLNDAKGKVVALTGAGCSTESSIPDYRSPFGAYSTGFKPMTHQQFMASHSNRQRYWARSFAGWERFVDAQPNDAHTSLAQLQGSGYIAKPLITQNVDRLHTKASADGDGNVNVLELHGTTHEVVCTKCGTTSCRREFQKLLANLNPAVASAARRMADQPVDIENESLRLLKAGTNESLAPDLREVNTNDDSQGRIMRPDGDAELHQPDLIEAFIVPPCACCGGALKPDVVFFGDSIPKNRADWASQVVNEAEVLLVVGSSLAVWSAFRLAKAVHENGKKVAIVTAGPTRADGFADVKIEARAGEFLREVVKRLGDSFS